MSQYKLKKLLALSITSALLVTQFAFVQAKADLSGYDLIEDYERYDQTTNVADNIISTSAIPSGYSVTLKSVDNNKYLNIENKSSVSFNPCLKLCDANSNPMSINVVKDSVYNFRFSISYKAEDTSTPKFYIQPAFINPSSSKNLGLGKTITFDKNSNSQNDSNLYATLDGEWRTLIVSTSIKATAAKNGVFMGLLLKCESGTRNINISFDNISVKQLPSDSQINNFTFNSDGGSILDIYSDGVAGESITLPQPQKNGFIFEGWYTDINCTTKFNNIVPSPNSLNLTFLYAKWNTVELENKITENFEQYDSNYVLNNFSFSTGTPAVTEHQQITIEEENNNKYLKYTSDGIETTNFQPYMLLKNSDNSPLNQSITNGKTYRIMLEYKYKIENDYGDNGVYLEPCFMKADKGLLTKSKKAIIFGSYNDYDRTKAFGSICDCLWHTESVVLTIDSTKNWANSEFGFQFKAGTRTITASFDDISVTILSDNKKATTMSFDSNAKLNKEKCVRFSTDDYTLPSFNIENANFDNIYTNEKCEQIYDGSFSEEDINLYVFFTPQIEKDYNFSGNVDIKDLIRLEKNISKCVNSYNASDLIALKKVLLFS